MRLVSLVFVLALAALLPSARAESPQHVAVELKFGPYFPDLDSSPTGDGGTVSPLFSDLLGDVNAPRAERPPWGLLSQVEIDYQFLHRFGVLGVGIQGGYFRRAAPQRVYFTQGDGTKQTCSIRTVTKPGLDGVEREYRQFVLPNGTDTPPGPCLSSDENILNIVPVSLLLVYRFDVLDKRWRVPLIPYVKVGLSSYFWWFAATGQTVVDSQIGPDGREAAERITGSGATLGFVVLPGLAVDLGAIDRQAAYVMDRELGLNRVSAFIEMNYARIDNFGRAGERELGGRIGATTLVLSDLAFSAGLSFEF